MLYFVGIIVPLISVLGHFVNLIHGGRNWEVFQFVVCKKHLFYLILLWYQKVAIQFVFLMCTVPSLLCPYLFLNNKDLVVDGFLLWLPPLGSSCKMKWLQLIVQWTRREIVSLPHSQAAHGSMYKWRRNNRLPIAGSTFSDGHHVWKVLSGSSSLLQVESISRSSYIKIFWDEMYRVSKRLLITRKKIPTEIEFCGAKFAHEHDLGALDPVNCLSKKRPKNIFPVRGTPGGGAGYLWLHSLRPQWFQQRSISQFFGTPCSTAIMSHDGWC